MLSAGNPSAGNGQQNTAAPPEKSRVAGARSELPWSDCGLYSAWTVVPGADAAPAEKSCVAGARSELPWSDCGLSSAWTVAPSTEAIWINCGALWGISEASGELACP